MLFLFYNLINFLIFKRPPLFVKSGFLLFEWTIYIEVAKPSFYSLFIHLHKSISLFAYLWFIVWLWYLLQGNVSFYFWNMCLTFGNHRTRILATKWKARPIHLLRQLINTYWIFQAIIGIINVWILKLALKDVNFNSHRYFQEQL